jgi:N-methylhydantoinase B/oxoprolinase/acetone carboxylase alpha subunit
VARPVAEVLSDVREGYVSPEAAREHYKVIVTETAAGWAADEAATAGLRGASPA